MQPNDLNHGSFAKYPPQAQTLAIAYVDVFRKTPLTLLPIILREVMDYDWSFPREKSRLTRQLMYLQSLPPASFAALVAPFAAIRLPTDISKIDWVNQPQHFGDQLSATLWSMQEMDDYRKAAQQYQKQLQLALIEKPPLVPRFTIVVVGQGVRQTSLPLFRPLRPHGTLFTSVQPANGLPAILEFINHRAKAHAEDYAHWYIDGGKADASCGAKQGVTSTSYNNLAPAALKELNLTGKFVQSAQSNSAMGPEAVQSFMAALRPEDLGLQGGAKDAPLRHFEVRVLTEGAGTQVFSTTFVQWSAREAMRRAQPVTMLARFAPRQRMAPMNELLHRNPLIQATDPEGSLMDGDMGAYYTWINQTRLPGADQARFLVWHEDQNLALAIAPGLPKSTTSESAASLEKILQWMA